MNYELSISSTVNPIHLTHLHQAQRLRNPSHTHPANYPAIHPNTEDTDPTQMSTLRDYPPPSLKTTTATPNVVGLQLPVHPMAWLELIPNAIARPLALLAQFRNRNKKTSTVDRKIKAQVGRGSGAGTTPFARSVETINIKHKNIKI